MPVRVEKLSCDEERLRDVVGEAAARGGRVVSVVKAPAAGNGKGAGLSSVVYRVVVEYDDGGDGLAKPPRS